MPSPSSGGRRSRRSAAVWTYATDRTGQVLWYCPPGGSEDKRCRNRLEIQDYWKKQYGSTTSIPYRHFTFKKKDVQPYWKSVNADTGRDDESDEGQERNGVGERGGGNAYASRLAEGPGQSMTGSSSPETGTVRNGDTIVCHVVVHSRIVYPYDTCTKYNRSTYYKQVPPVRCGTYTSRKSNESTLKFHEALSIYRRYSTAERVSDLHRQG